MAIQSSNLSDGRRVFTGLSTDIKPSSSSGWKPEHNDLFVETDTLTTYGYDGAAWVAGLFGTLATAEVPREADTYPLAIDAAIDGITDETAVAVAELYKLTPPNNCVGAFIKLEYDSKNGVPHARGILVVPGAADDASAASAMSMDNTALGPGTYTSGRKDLFGLNLDDELEVSWAKGTVATFYAAWLLTTGTGANPVRALVIFKSQS